MFDLRYHVASLAAVFVALIIGILVGVGLSGSGVTKNAELKNVKLENARLNSQLRQTNTQLKSLNRTESAFEQAYPALMANRLAGKRIALLFVGPVNGGIAGAIERTLSDAGAPPPLRIRAVSVPVRPDQLDSVLFAHKQFVQYVGNDKLTALGRALGSEFTLGGQTPLWNLLTPQLVEERSGAAKQPADGVIVVRTVKPQQGGTARFLAGLLSGLGAGGTPVVGVEATTAQNSAIGVFADRGLSSVDDIDTPAGRLALALLLAGAPQGQYGVKATADGGLLPPVEPVAAPSSG